MMSCDEEEEATNELEGPPISHLDPNRERKQSKNAIIRHDSGESNQLNGTSTCKAREIKCETTKSAHAFVVYTRKVKNFKARVWPPIFENQSCAEKRNEKKREKRDDSTVVIQHTPVLPDLTD